MNKIELKIKVSNEQVELIISRDAQIVDRIEIADGKKISRELLPALDLILKRNKLKLELIDKINLESNLSSNFTSQRIAQTIKNVLLWSKDNKNCG